MEGVESFGNGRTHQRQDRKSVKGQGLEQLTPDQSRKKREEYTVEIRKAKREDNLQKRRFTGVSFLHEGRKASQLETEGVNGSQGSSDPTASINNNNQVAVSDAQLAAHIAAEVSQLPNYVAAICSSDPNAQLQATIQLRKLLSIERGPPIQEVIHSGVVPHLIPFLSQNHLTKLQFEAAWVLTNIASGTSEQTRVVVELGGVPAFVHLLKTATEDDLREQAIWALGNIAGDSPQMRDFVLSFKADIAEPLITVLDLSVNKVSLMRNATWTLSNLCRGRPAPKLADIQVFLPILNKLVRYNDVEVIIDACWAWSYISDGNIANIQAVIDSGVTSRMVQLLNHPSYKVQTPALRTVGNIISGTKEHTQVVINANVIPLLYRLLNNQRKGLRKEACWAISNIAASCKELTHVAIQSNVFNLVVKQLGSSELDVKKEAAWAVSNATVWKVPDHVRTLINYGCAKPLCDLLISPDSKVIMLSLEAIDNILATGEIIVQSGAEPVNPFKVIIEEAEGIDRMEQLQDHQNNEIYQKAVKILETYFSGEEEHAAIAPAISPNQQSYTFGIAQTTPQQPGGFTF